MAKNDTNPAKIARGYRKIASQLRAAKKNLRSKYPNITDSQWRKLVQRYEYAAELACHAADAAVKDKDTLRLQSGYLQKTVDRITPNGDEPLDDDAIKNASEFFVKAKEWAEDRREQMTSRALTA